MVSNNTKRGWSNCSITLSCIIGCKFPSITISAFLNFFGTTGEIGPFLRRRQPGIGQQARHLCEVGAYADHLYIRKHHIASLAFSIIGAKVARIAYGVLKSNCPFSPQLGQNKKSLNNLKEGNLSFFERKDLRRAKQALRRIQELKGLTQISLDIESLVTSLEEILAKK